MAIGNRESRAFIIGDKEHGLTIVITDPVMVLHYSKEDLADAQYNDMWNQKPNDVLAGVVQELLQYFRTDVDLLDKFETDYRSGSQTYTLDQIERLFAERNNAATIGRIIRANGSVHDVDFCLAMTIVPSEIAARARSVGPGNKIGPYVNNHKNGAPVPAQSQRFVIGTLPVNNLDELEPWKP